MITGQYVEWKNEEGSGTGIVVAWLCAAMGVCVGVIQTSHGSFVQVALPNIKARD